MNTPKRQDDSQNRNRSLSLLLLLPLLCAVMFCASQFGVWIAPNTGVERLVNPNETADYKPWYDLIFAPVDDALLTSVAGNEEVVILGVATAVPTVERNLEEIVGLPPTSTPAPQSSEAGRTAVAQAQTDVANPNSAATSATQANNTSSPSNSSAATNTARPSSTARATNTTSASSTPRASSTSRASNTPVPTVTATVTATRTASPTATSLPTSTTIPAPNANFSASPLSGQAPLNVQFTNLSTGATAYTWNFGDGTSSNSVSPSHIYASAGSYTVILFVTGAGGSDNASVTIVVSIAPSATPTTNPDTDGDGVPNSSDACPTQGGIVRANGCPRDTDNDGVVDNDDRCPTQGDAGYGLRSNGCPRPAPDTDGDGYRDNVDLCPADGGIVDGTGCPLDSDGDGVVDNNDSCPSQGSIGFGIDASGCPIGDSDSDGVGDNVDLCPAQGGIVDANGCPSDTDGDGIVDNSDLCPSQGGIIDANGCPLDSDSDGVVDNNDLCPADGGIVDANGCPLDTDGDGYVDNVDLCPTQGDAGYGLDGNGCPNAAPSLSVSQLVLINTDDQSVIMVLGSSETISLAAIGTSNIAIRADLANCSTPCSVEFYVDGGFFRNENGSPYAIAGDSGGNLNSWSYSTGSQTIEAIPYTNPNGNGTQGTSRTVTLTINP